MALRPGVTITTQYRTYSQSETYPIAIYAKGGKTASGIQFIQTPAQAVAVFGEDNDQSPLTRMILLCLEGGAAGVWAQNRTADEETALKTEFSAFLDSTQGEFLVTDVTQQSLLVAMKEVLEQQGVRKILFAGGSADPTALNSMRCVLACPQVKWEESSTVNLAPAAAAVLVSKSSRIIGGNGSAMEFSGWVEGMTEAQKEEKMEQGISVLELSGGLLTLIRGIDTCTQDELGNTDYRYFNLSTPLILDYVVGELESYLTPLCLGGATLDGIESLCAAKLMELEQEGYLSAYGVPSAAAAEDDPSCCLLTVSFTPARNIVTVQATLVVQI